MPIHTKNKQWQEYAAATAAAYVILLVVPVIQITIKTPAAVFRGREDFECEICHTIGQASATALIGSKFDIKRFLNLLLINLRMHVFEGLQPYICTSAGALICVEL
jgi:hypothetical protein